MKVLSPEQTAVTPVTPRATMSGAVDRIWIDTPADPSATPSVVPGVTGDAAGTDEAGRILQHAGYPLGARLAMALARGAGLVLISRALGPAEFGNYSLVLATFAIGAAVGTFGMDQSNIYHTGSGRRAPATLVRDALWMAVVLGSIAAALLLCVTGLLRGRIFDTTPLTALVLTAAALPSVLLHNYLTGIVIGRGWFRYYGGLEIGKWSLHVALLGLLAATHELDLESALLVLYAPIALVGFVHLTVLLRRDRVPARTTFGGRPEPRQAVEALGFGARACAIGLGQVLHQRLDVYLVKYLTTAASVGQYALAANIADVILYGGRSVGLVVFARRAGDSDRTQRSPAVLCRTILLVIAVVALAVFVTSEAWIGHVFGMRYLQATDAVSLRLPGIIAESVSLVLVGDFLGSAATSGVLRATLLAIATGLALNLTFVPFGGIAAAAAAFSVASWVRLGGLVRRHAALTGTPVRSYLVPRAADLRAIGSGMATRLRRRRASGGVQS